jgi:type IV secretory pathway TraG/TraD family ATPase VirD4
MTVVGLWRTYSILPEVYPIPGLFFWVLIGIGLIGVRRYQKSQKTMYPIMITVTTLIWSFIQVSFDKIWAYANKLASNPYAHYEAITVAKTIVYIPLILGVLICAVIFQMLRLKKKADPLYEENYKEQDIIKNIKSKIINLKNKAQTIKEIWLLTDINKKKIPLTHRIKGIDKALFEKPFKEEFALGICIDTKTGKKINIKYLDMFLHFLILGPTGSGKTFGVIKPIAWQVIKYMIQNKKIGLTVVEPKGDLVEDIAGWCEKLKIPHVYINPLDENSAKFNPLQGDAQVVAESTRTVLQKLFGKQEAFFAQVQETSARNTILLLKRLHGDNLGLHDVIQVLRDQEKLKTEVQNLERKAGSNDDLVQYFQKEILGSLKSEYQRFAMGLRMQLEDLLGNEMLKKVITGNSDINFDKHLKEGGILVVNTAMGPLGKLGDAFGTFVVMHLQNAVFRRPGNEHTRTPHVLIIDEAPRYINPDFERLLTIGRSFRCACVMAIQSLGQLEMEEKKAFTNIVMTNCRNKIIFGGIDEEDARKFEREFGTVETGMIQPTYNYNVLIPPIFPKSFRETKTQESRFTFTQIKELPRYHFFYHLTVQGQLLPPGIGTGSPVNINEIKPRYSKDEQASQTSIEIKQKQSTDTKIVAQFISQTNSIRFVKPEAPANKESAKKTPVAVVDNQNPEAIKAENKKSPENLKKPTKEQKDNVQVYKENPFDEKNPGSEEDDPWADLEDFE